MNPAASTFAEITAVLEDMHGVAIEDQAPDVTDDEGWALLAGLRSGAEHVARLMVVVALTLG